VFITLLTTAEEKSTGNKIRRGINVIIHTVVNTRRYSKNLLFSCLRGAINNGNRKRGYHFNIEASASETLELKNFFFVKKYSEVRVSREGNESK